MLNGSTTQVAKKEIDMLKLPNNIDSEKGSQNSTQPTNRGATTVPMEVTSLLISGAGIENADLNPNVWSPPCGIGGTLTVQSAYLSGTQVAKLRQTIAEGKDSKTVF